MMDVERHHHEADQRIDADHQVARADVAGDGDRRAVAAIPELRGGGYFRHGRNPERALCWSLRVSMGNRRVPMSKFRPISWARNAELSPGSLPSATGMPVKAGSGFNRFKGFRGCWVLRFSRSTGPF